jgi:hypothetical protein
LEQGEKTLRSKATKSELRHDLALMVGVELKQYSRMAVVRNGVTNMNIQTSVKNNSFVSINQTSLNEVLGAIATKYDMQLRSIEMDKSHLKAAKGMPATKNIYTLQSTNIQALADSPVAPRIQIKDQTYSGAALQLRIGLWRQVCSNGLMGFKFSEERITHHKKNEVLFQQLDEAVERLVSLSPKLLEQVQELQLKKIEWQSVIGQLGLSPNMVDSVGRFIQAGFNRVQDDPNTAWGLYNIVNELDRRKARRGSVAFMQRDEQMLGRILAVA